MQCEIRIACRQCPYGVQMIGEHNDCFDREWVSQACVAKGGAERTDVIGQKPQLSVRQVHREEIASAGDKIAPIAGHLGLRS
jgi:hypothetical protein